MFATLSMAGLANGALYALVALGLVLIYKTQDVVNFAHGEVLMIGAFAGYTAYQNLGWAYPFAFLGAIVFCGVLGAVVERLCFRRIAHHHHITLAMVTVGLSFAFKGLARVPFGADLYTFPPLFQDVGPIMIGGAIVTPQNLVTIGVAVVLTLLLFLFFKVTTMGKQMRATQQNLTGAKMVGIDTGRVFALTWALAAAIGGAAGVLLGPSSLLYPDMGSNFLLKGFAAAVLGGFESVPGAIIGGLLIGVIEKLFGGYVSTAFEHISAFCVIIGVLFVRPYGLFGRKPIHRV
ncbi:MAG: branched-chain amino acid ABC transporter permease [Burkholderiales bacterium]|nr:MAG: branched-chain amino acid ABC transporter permease [Burkholderiales bacterium]